jgi:hypothetical protein
LPRIEKLIDDAPMHAMHQSILCNSPQDALHEHQQCIGYEELCARKLENYTNPVRVMVLVLGWGGGRRASDCFIPPAHAFHRAGSPFAVAASLLFPRWCGCCAAEAAAADAWAADAADTAGIELQGCWPWSSATACNLGDELRIFAASLEAIPLVGLVRPGSL